MFSQVAIFETRISFKLSGAGTSLGFNLGVAGNSLSEYKNNFLNGYFHGDISVKLPGLSPFNRAFGQDAQRPGASGYGIEGDIGLFSVGLSARDHLKNPRICALDK